MRYSFRQCGIDAARPTPPAVHQRAYAQDDMTSLGRADDVAILLVRLVALALLAAGLGLAAWCWGYQAMFFLESGNWMAIGALDGLVNGFDAHRSLPWLGSPTSWLGLHSILNWPNAGVVALSYGLWFRARVLALLDA